MILTCSKCSTQFSVPAGALGVRGRKVKCSRCSHSWFQAPDPSDIPIIPEVQLQPVVNLDREPIVAMPEPVMEAAKPVAAAPKVYAPAHPALKITAAMLALFAIISGAFASTSILGISAVPAALGITDTQGYALQDISYTSTALGQGKMSLAFKGAVRNDAAETRPAPIVTVILYDRSGRELRALDYQFPTPTVEAGKTIAFEPKINNVPDSLSLVVLELGNGVEQTLR